MKTVILVIIVAVISSAATVGVLKFMEGHGTGGSIIVVSDKRCAECNTARLESSLKRTFPEVAIEVVDYNTRKGKKLYKNENLEKLPAVLLPQSMSETEGFKKIQRFATLGKNYYALRTGGKFDPTAEICDNKKDDTGNGLVDCADPTCKTDWTCMEKRDKPTVDLFVMSHCPYGTQMEKGMLPVIDLLGDKADINIRFVDYAMHGKKEVDEELKQYCVQEQGKIRKYLECFLKEGKTDDTCVKAAGVDTGKLASCIKKADKEFGVTASFNDKKKWKGRFPPFPIHAEKSKKYGVRGSPTLVVNDVVVKGGRSPKDIRDAICKGFKNPPPECKKKVSADTPSPGFGLGKSKAGGKKGGAAGAKCGA